MNRFALASFLPVLLLPTLFLGAGASAQTPDAPAPESQFFRIDVQHYDAGVMADLITRQDAIIAVPPNFVFAEGGPASAPPAGFGLRPAPAAANRLPEGVQRIYALRADNSLVIQTTPDFHRNSVFPPIR